MTKERIGDGPGLSRIYAQAVRDGFVSVTLEFGDDAAVAMIVFAPSTLNALVQYAERVKAENTTPACRMDCSRDAQIPGCGQRGTCGYLCTRAKGHDGQHVACSREEHAVECWDAKPEPKASCEIKSGEGQTACPRCGGEKQIAVPRYTHPSGFLPCPLCRKEP